MTDIQKLIRLDKYPVENVLDKLLLDKTTKRNIIFATDAYKYKDGSSVEKTEQITREVLEELGLCAIQPRVCKSLEEQAERTKKKAEVFTPAWICNRMNNHCDEEWFGRKGVFNTEKDLDDGSHSWDVTEEKIDFPQGLSWQDYVYSKRLEITCGEAPYIVSRYDAATGEIIPISRRIGILDRKLRVVNENASTEEEWLEWAYKAFQSTYGYEFQGDNLLIARVNLLMTFVEYMQLRWNREPVQKELCKVANIIAWNIWQMDGLTGLIPFRTLKVEEHDLFDFTVADEEPVDDTPCECRIYDWRANNSVIFNSIKHSR